MSIGAKLTAARKSAGMTQERLAERLEVTPQAISTWERNENLPDTRNLIALGKILGVSLDDLVSEEEPPSWELRSPTFNPEHMYTYIKAKAQAVGLTQTLAALPPAFHVAFMKPGQEATVWREKSYEIYREGTGKGVWETGQFDRVVFTGEGAEREAVIYDFKTNALRAGEPVETFEGRMRRTYAPQMTAYRAALGTLTGLSASRIRSVLLLQSTGTAVECGD